MTRYLRYLTAEDILRIHSIIIDETGGSHGLRDRNILLSLEHKPCQSVFGKELYPTIFLKAAVYIEHLIAFHPFVDGNKRTAMTSAGVFLENNGLKFSAGEGEIEHFALYVATKKPPLPEIAAWLKKHSRKIKKRKGR